MNGTGQPPSVSPPTGAVPMAGAAAPSNPGVTAMDPAPSTPMIIEMQPAGMAGSGAQMDPPEAGAPAKPPVEGTTEEPKEGELALDECGLDTAYPGDEFCILPPPPDKGFQLHIGPSNYDNPESRYIINPGEETTQTFTAVSGNDKPIYFYYRQFRMRNGAHHNIITAGGAGDFGLGQRIGTTNALAEDSPKGGIIAPENEGVGIRLAARTTISVSLHTNNFSEKPMLREMWVNFWYRPEEEVTEPVEEIFAPANQPPIPPGADMTFGGTCTISGNGRMLWMYGHRHANNVRFTTWRTRGGQKDLIYQGYDWEEALVLEYSSTVQNPMADTGPMVEGGWSGILDLKTGDKLEWECHVINKTDGTLLFTNNTFTGEMCIVDAETVGSTCL